MKKWVVRGHPNSKPVHEAATLRMLMVYHKPDVVYCTDGLACDLLQVLPTGTKVLTLPEGGAGEGVDLIVSLWEHMPKEWAVAAHRRQIAMVEVV